MHNSNWYERQYNTSFSVADEDAVLVDWQTRAAATRAAHMFKADIAYGAHPREVLDFYPAQNARGVMVFIHGGYWRGLSKVETSWVADGFLSQGISVALINYPLCPKVTIADIGQSVRNATAYLYQHVLNDAERNGIVVAGHSAGGYLAALHAATDWSEYGLPADPLAGVIGISGIYDPAPLIHTSMNDALHLTSQSAADLNLMAMRPRTKTVLLLAAGGAEPQEFHRQAEDLAAAWKSVSPMVWTLEARNHFEVMDGLSNAEGVLNVAVQTMISREF